MPDVDIGSRVVDDLAVLNELDEKRLLHELKTRYHSDTIYTNVGDILIAINPYKQLPIYGQQAIDYYIGLSQHSRVRPHIYTVADRVYQAVVRTGRSQCCLVSGESGSGKTESTKFLIRHIVHQKSQRSDSTLHEMIIQVNPLLEAFGNAETLVNSNSSRFGKFIQINLDLNGAIAGARLSQYLLEKSRVVRRGTRERNFHVFYNLLAGLSASEMRRFLLDRPENYRILLPAQGGPVYLSDADLLHHQNAYTQLRDIIQLIGFASEEVDAIFGLLATILHVTNIRFIPETDFDGVYIENEYELDVAASLLGVNVEDLATVLISNISIVRGEKIITMKSMDQADDGRDALAKAIYSRLFAWIVRCVNVALDTHMKHTTTDAHPTRNVGILDLAGFENFPTNSFEQLCINITNEQLQFFFNQAIFDWEIRAYEAEGIKHGKVKFTNNGPVLEMLLEQPIGLLSLLDEESRLARTTDASLIEKFNKYLTKYDSYRKTKHKSLMFTVCHYAGEVSVMYTKVRYYVENFLVKNQDNLGLNMTELLRHSASWIVYELFMATLDDTGIVQFDPNAIKRSRSSVMACKPPDMAKYAQSMSRKAGKKLKQKMKNNQQNGERQNNNQVTVCSHFRNSLAELMEKIQRAEPHFIRCIKPNNQKAANDFNEPLVLSQLRYTGVLETTRIRRNGYPTRLPFAIFMDRYKLLSPAAFIHRTDTSHSCEAILTHLGLKDWQIGKSRVFLKYWHMEHLNMALDRLKRSTVILQNVTRMFVCQRRLRQHKTMLAAQMKATHDFCVKVELQMAGVRGMLDQQSKQDTARHEEMKRERARRMKELAQAHMMQKQGPSSPANSSEAFIGQRVIPKGIHSVHLRKVRENMSRLCEFSSYEDFQNTVLSEIKSKLPSLDLSIWAKVIYMERNRQVAKFYLSKNEVTINGSTEAFVSSVIGINRFTSHAVDDAVAAVRSRFLKGLQLKTDRSGNIYCTKLGSCAICVHNYENTKDHCFSTEVLSMRGNLTVDQSVKIFDMNKFKANVSHDLPRTPVSLARLDRLSLTCLVLEQEGSHLLDTPCWLCVVNIHALNTLTNEPVLKEIRNNSSPQSPGTNIQDLSNNNVTATREWSKLNHRSGIAPKAPPARKARIEIRRNNEKIKDHMPYSWKDAVRNGTVQQTADEKHEQEILTFLDQSFIKELVESDDESRTSQVSNTRVMWAKRQFEKFSQPQQNHLKGVKGKKG